MDLTFFDVGIFGHCHGARCGAAILFWIFGVSSLYDARFSFSVLSATFARALLFADDVVFYVFFWIPVFAYFDGHLDGA